MYCAKFNFNFPISSSSCGLRSYHVESAEPVSAFVGGQLKEPFFLESEAAALSDSEVCTVQILKSKLQYGHVQLLIHMYY